MPVRIVLRQRKEYSPFRDLLHNLIVCCPGDNSLILCSGYIQENSYYSILDDELLSVLSNYCNEIITIAGKFRDAKWENQYRNFIKKLRQSDINVTAYSSPLKNWHAKIAIKLHNETPIAALIGSSNFTRPAYGINLEEDRWNYEADVLIWLNEFNSYFEQIKYKQKHGIIDLILNPKVDQPNEQEQLRELKRLLMEESGLKKFK